MEENIRNLKEILSIPLLISLLNGLFNLFLVLTTLLKYDVTQCRMIELMTRAFIGIVNIVPLVICSSKIPENMMKIKETFGLLIEKHQLHFRHKGKGFSILKRIERKNEIYLSAYGMIDFRRSFLLTAFGSLLTYGLLVSNLE
ncbi:hypothetical protein AVEN_32683-1 [Araneus ventricosus]|uniref:Uncharacterized protein n=1 Tax=Araneus ventricosus TaxID=182803 RepID=A0A4Y2PFR7_ARAVE|nr:hypothetical protein AVEN_32683-1 [Araneus ventricosus]